MLEYWEYFKRCSLRSDWLVGSVRDIAASFRNNKGLGGSVKVYFYFEKDGGDVILLVSNKLLGGESPSSVQ